MSLLNPYHPRFFNRLPREDLDAFTELCFRTVNPGTPYMPNWHMRLISEYLLAAERGDIKRLIINLPPRHLKSLSVNVAWPAWLLGHNPSRRIISASYSQALAGKHSLDTRLIMRSGWYKRTFPHTRITEGQNEKEKYVTTKRGFRLATSVGGTLTGEGGNFLILDDPHNPAHMHSQTMREQTLTWYEQVFASRLDDRRNGVIVLVMQRLHEKDLTGHLLAKNSGWRHLCIPALAPTRLEYDIPNREGLSYIFHANTALHSGRDDAAMLTQLRAELGSHTFSAQYLQNPMPADDGLIKRQWLRHSPAPPEYTSITQSWDTAIKAGAGNDYSVCTTWAEAENGYYLLDILREKLEFPQLRRAIISQAEKWKPDAILIEDKASGGSLIQDIRAESRLPVIAINPMGDKFSRLASVTPLFESGRIFLPSQHPHLQDAEAELLTFPHAAHDDITDTISQYLIWAKKRRQVSPRIRWLG